MVPSIAPTGGSKFELKNFQNTIFLDNSNLPSWTEQRAKHLKLCMPFPKISVKNFSRFSGFFRIPWGSWRFLGISRNSQGFLNILGDSLVPTGISRDFWRFLEQFSRCGGNHITEFLMTSCYSVEVQKLKKPTRWERDRKRGMIITDTLLSHSSTLGGAFYNAHNATQCPKQSPKLFPSTTTC